MGETERDRKAAIRVLQGCICTVRWPAFTLAAKVAGLDLPISISTTSEVFDVLLFLFSFFFYSLGVLTVLKGALE